MKKQLTLLTICTFLFLGSVYADNSAPQPTTPVKEFLDLKLGLFIHFGINTYTADEWTDGSVPTSLYDPKELDTDQWCAAAESAGMKYVVFTAKHHDGFCNWNTKYTDYSVKKTPFKKDVLKALAASCKKYGLKLGIYYSLWDRHESCYKDNYQYTEFMKSQLDELLSNYGDITLVWFDGAWDKCSGFGFDGPLVKGEEIMRHWRDEGVYNWQWDQIYSFIKHKSPNCLVMNNSGINFTGIPLMPVDIRSGERANKSAANKTSWEFCGQSAYLPMQIEETVSRKNWFYHAGDDTFKTTKELKKLIEDAADMKANLLLNVGPMTNGLLRAEDVAVLKSLGK